MEQRKEGEGDEAGEKQGEKGLEEEETFKELLG